MPLTPENEESGSNGGERDTEGIRTRDSHTSGISPRGAIFSPHGNCVRRYSRSQSSEARPEAGMERPRLLAPLSARGTLWFPGPGARARPATRARGGARA